jgi:hypothetical protein
VVLRHTPWFAAASIVVTILHELARAGVAFGLGVRSTLHNYSADLDLRRAQAAPSAPALVDVAGPVFRLAFGMGSLSAFKRVRSSRVQLPLLHLSVFGIGTGNTRGLDTRRIQHGVREWHVGVFFTLAPTQPSWRAAAVVSAAGVASRRDGAPTGAPAGVACTC